MAQSNPWKTLRQCNFTVDDFLQDGFRFLHDWAGFKYDASVFEVIEDITKQELFHVRYKGWSSSQNMYLSAEEILDQGYPYTEENAQKAKDEITAEQVRKGYIKNPSRSSSSKRSSQKLLTSTKSSSEVKRQKKESFTAEIEAASPKAKSQQQKKKSYSFDRSASPSPIKSQLATKETSASKKSKAKAESSKDKSQKSKEDSILAGASSTLGKSRRTKEGSLISEINAETPKIKSQKPLGESSRAETNTPSAGVKFRKIKEVPLTSGTTAESSNVNSQKPTEESSFVEISSPSTRFKLKLIPASMINAETPEVKLQKPKETSSRAETSASSIRGKSRRTKEESLISETDAKPSKVKTSEKPSHAETSAPSTRIKRTKEEPLASKTTAASSNVKPKELSGIQNEAKLEYKAEKQVGALEFPPNLNISDLEGVFPAKVTIDEAISKYIHALKCGRPNPHPFHSLEMTLEEVLALKAQVNESLPFYCTEKECNAYFEELNKKRKAKKLKPLNLNDFLYVDKENKESLFKKLVKVQLPLTDVFDVLFMIRFMKAVNEKREGSFKYVFHLYRPLWNDMLKFISEKIVKNLYEEAESNA